MELVYKLIEETIKGLRKEQEEEQRVSTDRDEKYSLSIILKGLDKIIIDLNFSGIRYDQLLSNVNDLKNLTIGARTKSDGTKRCVETVEALYDYLVGMRHQAARSSISNNAKEENVSTIEQLKRRKYKAFLKADRQAYNLQNHSWYLNMRDRALFAYEDYNAINSVTLLQYVEESIKHFMEMSQNTFTLCNNTRQIDGINLIHLMLQTIQSFRSTDNNNYYGLVFEQLENIVDYMKELNLGNCPLVGEIQLVLVQLKKEEEVGVKAYLKDKFPDGQYNNSDLLDEANTLQEKANSTITTSECESVIEYNPGFMDYEALLLPTQIKMHKVNNGYDQAFRFQMLIVGLRKFRRPKQLEKLSQAPVTNAQK